MAPFILGSSPSCARASSVKALFIRAHAIAHAHVQKIHHGRIASRQKRTHASDAHVAKA